MGIELILAILGAVLGLPGFILAVPWMGRVAGRLVTRKVIFVFGPSGVGKTSFLRFLEERPVPTSHLATLGKSWTRRIAYRVGADERALIARAFVEFGAENETMFRTEFREQNPIGIVLIIDHARPADALIYASHVVDAVKQMSEAVVEEKIGLRCVLVLLNKADQWADNPHEIQQQLASYATNPVGTKIREVQRYKPNCQIVLRPSCLIDPQLKSYTVDALGVLAEVLRG